MNITYYFIYLRELLVNSFQTKIIGIVTDNFKIDNKSNIIYMINCLPFIFIYLIFYLTSIKYLYKRDGIIFYSKKEVFNISPCILEFKIIRSTNDICVKEILNTYFSNVPIKLIFDNENIVVNDDDEIKIKYLNSGKFVEKILNYKKIKLFSKGNLLN
jgi:hypothetical protein